MNVIPLFLVGGLLSGGFGYGLYVEVHEASPTGQVEPVPLVTAPYDGCDCTQQAMQLAWSLDHQEEQWSSDSYLVWRRGVYVWVANGAYGISVGKDDNVSPRSQGFGWAPPDQDRPLIARAYARWHERVSLHAEDIKP